LRAVYGRVRALLVCPRAVFVPFVYMYDAHNYSFQPNNTQAMLSAWLSADPYPNLDQVRVHSRVDVLVAFHTSVCIPPVFSSAPLLPCSPAILPCHAACSHVLIDWYWSREVGQATLISALAVRCSHRVVPFPTGQARSRRVGCTTE
jgi:hypothetical protein